MRVAITGATGSVGRALSASLLADGHEVHAITRSPKHPGEIGWSVEAGTLDRAALEGVDAVVHLAGETIGQRFTTAAMQRIRDSRVLGTRLIATTLASLDRKPRVLVSASAVGFYGDTGDRVVDEDSPSGTNFIATVAAAWEAETAPAEAAGIRVVRLRSGISLDKQHGLLAEQLLPAKLGLLGPIAGGRQWIPWVDPDDLIAAYRFCLDRDDLRGPVLACAPEPCTQREFVRELGGALGRPELVPTPGFAIRLAFGQMGQELILEGQRCRPKRLIEAGFTWRYPTLSGSLSHVLGTP